MLSFKFNDDFSISYSKINLLYLGKKNITALQMCIGIRNTAFFLANLKFADWDTKEICGFAICRLIITNLRNCDLWTGRPKKFAYLRLRNEPKNLLLCTQLVCII
jgi:hypothetical protein